jgi:alpha,alpha-trehalose phosphorylase
VWDLPNTPPDKLPLLLHYHPLVIYRFQVLKQADVVLALFLQGDQFTAAQKRADFDYYDPITTGDSTLSGCVQSIIAAEVGYADLALRYFEPALFVDLADLHNNSPDGVHVASLGGCWSAAVFGFGGLRDYDGQLSLDPRLPRSWEGLTFRICLRGSRLRVHVEPGAVNLQVEEGSTVDIDVRGETVTVGPERPVTLRLDTFGPQLPGEPASPALAGRRREDGTVITAALPGT